MCVGTWKMVSKVSSAPDLASMDLSVTCTPDGKCDPANASTSDTLAPIFMVPVDWSSVWNMVAPVATSSMRADAIALFTDYRKTSAGQCNGDAQLSRLAATTALERDWHLPL